MSDFKDLREAFFHAHDKFELIHEGEVEKYARRPYYPENKAAMALGTKALIAMKNSSTSIDEVMAPLMEEASAEVGSPNYHAITTAVFGILSKFPGARKCQQTYLSYLTPHFLCLCYPQTIHYHGAESSYIRGREVKHRGPISCLAGNRAIWGDKVLYYDRGMFGPMATRVFDDDMGWYDHPDLTPWMTRLADLSYPWDGYVQIPMRGEHKFVIYIFENLDIITRLSASTDHTRGPVMMTHYRHHKRQLHIYTPSKQDNSKGGDVWFPARTHEDRGGIIKAHCGETGQNMVLYYSPQDLTSKWIWDKRGFSEVGMNKPAPEPEPTDRKEKLLTGIESDSLEIRPQAGANWKFTQGIRNKVRQLRKEMENGH